MWVEGTWVVLHVATEVCVLREREGVRGGGVEGSRERERERR